jgi:GcrA cell cycle regulator
MFNIRAWSEESSEALKEYVLSGELSYSQIAALINERFGTSHSRNATIGRAGRMGLTNPFKVKVSSEPKKRKSRAVFKIVAANGNSSALRIYQSVKTDQPDLRCIEVGPRHLTLLELEPDDCRFAYGESNFTFCGLRTRAGSSYCPSHHTLVWVAPIPPRRPSLKVAA